MILLKLVLSHHAISIISSILAFATTKPNNTWALSLALFKSKIVILVMNYSVKSIKEVLEIALINLPTAVLDGNDKTEERTEGPKEVPIIPQSESTESPRTYDA